MDWGSNLDFDRLEMAHSQKWGNNLFSLIQ